MKFGYFFMGAHFSSEGSAFSHVQIRPMSAGTLQSAGMRVDIRVPLHTAYCDSSLPQVAAQALQSAAQLLPESALAAWADGKDLPLMIQPCLPKTALADWNKPLEF